MRWDDTEEGLGEHSVILWRRDVSSFVSTRAPACRGHPQLRRICRAKTIQSRPTVVEATFRSSMSYAQRLSSKGRSKFVPASPVVAFLGRRHAADTNATGELDPGNRVARKECTALYVHLQKRRARLASRACQQRPSKLLMARMLQPLSRLGARDTVGNTGGRMARVHIFCQGRTVRFFASFSTYCTRVVTLKKTIVTPKRM